MLSIIGWQTGATLSFFISQKYGRKIVKKLTNLDKIDKILTKIPRKKQFLAVFLLRIILPVDALSYALGLTKIRFQTYFWATLTGITPFAILFSLGGEMWNSRWIAVILFAIIILFWVTIKILKKI